ncbi:MAG: ATP-binding protein, partial [Bacteroidota bacterium]
IEQRRPVFVVRLMTYDYWLDQAPILRNILQAIFHAIMWFMFFSSLLNYFSQKSNAYLYYALFLASASFYFLSVSGMLMEIFLQENPKANSFVWVFASNLIGIGYFQFARSFLNTKRLMPLYDKIGRWIIIGALILIGVELIILQLTFNFDFLEKLNRGVLFAEVTFLLIVSLLYARHSKGVSRIFFWGTLCIVASGYLGLILNQMGLFHASLPAVEFLFVVQTLNFSWGLGYRQYQMQEERIEKRAEAANLRTLNEMKSRFFANISHEFRTPLTLLLGESESLQSEGESYTSKKRGEKLGVIRRMGQNLLELVNQILDLSKLDARSYEADWQYGDVIDFIKERAEIFASFAQNQQKQLQFETERERLKMDFDPKALQIILSNLLSNAIKFSPEGEVVHLRLQIEDGPQMEEMLLIEVADNGFGIPPEDLPHLFDRYFQSAQNRSNAAGTGIGLSLVKALVQMMGGEISVESELDKGTRFVITLPVNHAHQAVAVSDGTAVAMPNLPLALSETAKKKVLSISDFEKNLVLIVEDNPEVLQFVRSILETDYRIAIARDGGEGERLALELIPDLIVSDVGMPVMDGFQLTQRLKQDERTSHIPIILLTARAEEKDRLQGLSFGADAYLTKPFRQAELKVRIEKLIELRESLRRRFVGQEVEAVEKEPSREEVFLQQIKSIILANLLNPELNPELLAEKMNMSYTQLYRKLK